MAKAVLEALPTLACAEVRIGDERHTHRPKRARIERKGEVRVNAGAQQILRCAAVKEDPARMRTSAHYYMAVAPTSRNGRCKAGRRAPKIATTTCCVILMHHCQLDAGRLARDALDDAKLIS